MALHYMTVGIDMIKQGSMLKRIIIAKCICWGRITGCLIGDSLLIGRRAGRGIAAHASMATRQRSARCHCRAVPTTTRLHDKLSMDPSIDRWSN
jgi:hypothetical protein